MWSDLRRAVTSVLMVGVAAVRYVAFFAITVGTYGYIRASMAIFPPADDATRVKRGVQILHRWAKVALWVFGIRVQVKGELPKPGSLVMTNHHSYLDIVVLASVFPTSFLAKAEVGEWPVIGPGARALGLLFVKREERHERERARQRVMATVERGVTIVNFPEGTTSCRGQPLPLRPGVFHAAAGRAIKIVPASLGFVQEGTEWVGDATFLDHVFGQAMRPVTDVEVGFSAPLDCFEHDGEQLKQKTYEAIAKGMWNFEATHRGLTWLPKPWLKTMTKRIQKGAFEIRTYDQPGRWMRDHELRQLQADLRHVGSGTIEDDLEYGIFSADRAAFDNRVIAVAYDTEGNVPVAFTAMVYLPFYHSHDIEVVVHLGLTMIAKAYRGRRLQTELFKMAWWSPVINQFRISFTVTNIAASPAGIGATSDYFLDVYPSYHGGVPQKDYHLKVAQQILGHSRHEFGCSKHAVFDPHSFLVSGSNEPSGGGAHQLCSEDPTSRYRVDACNTYCRELIDYSNGDEIFQVGRMHLLQGTWASRSSRRGIKPRTPDAARA